IALSLALGSLEIHHLMNDGRLAADMRTFTEPGLLTSLWLLAAVMLLDAHRMTGRWLHRAAAIAVAIVATIYLVAVVLCIDSPLFNRVAVGDLLLLDWLLAGYLIPAALLAAFAWRSE